MTINRASVADADESTLLPALRAGDEAAFQRLTDKYRRELLVHCYRMLGSLDDAEDMLQETLLRAWRGLESFQGRSPVRSWLYKIATNVCLDFIASRKRRVLPNVALAAANPGDPLPGPSEELVWLEPVPDALIDLRPSANPEAYYDARESVELAFLATLQTLPGRQRAVLILRDVLGWTASEVAELLGSSAASVNSALQRARIAMKAYRKDRKRAETTRADSEATTSLLARYVDAWQAADTKKLVALLRDDVVFTMPPLPLWYRGREAIAWFLDTQLFAGDGHGRFRVEATRANASPAFALYQRDAAGVYRFGGLHVLQIEDGQIATIDDFLGPADKLSRRFELPLALPPMN